MSAGENQGATLGSLGYSQEDEATVQMIDVSRRYWVGSSEVIALERVNLEIYQGQFVVVLGPSGSGKTTLINLIGALDVATDGEVVVGGRRISGASRAELARFRRETVSFIFQSFNLFPGLTARENVQFAREVTGRNRNGDEEDDVSDVLRSVGLGNRFDHFPHELSGGEQQRVAIARALATGNQIILADEPTGELDFRTGVQILSLLHEQADAGRTVLVVTHNREISRVADRVIELSSGHVVQDGPPANGRVDAAELSW